MAYSLKMPTVPPTQQKPVDCVYLVYPIPFKGSLRSNYKIK